MTLNEFSYFYPEKPTLISIDQPLFEMVNNSPSWIAEKKYNGCRLQLHYLNGQFQFYGRHGIRLKFEVGEELKDPLDKLNLKGYCLFDGELRNNKVKGVSQKIIFYDIFIWENELLWKMPFRQRRDILNTLFEIESEPIGLTKQFDCDFVELFNRITDDEIEGLVIKNLQGKLDLGKKKSNDSAWMVKIRRPHENYKF
jgi:ATP-dependent DNA ligase